MKSPIRSILRTRLRIARHSRGIALIEVLVALLLFMLGVLGMVGLQGAMTRAQTDSKFRADAGNLAGEAISRMWSDLSNLASYNGSSCASTARCKAWQDKVSAALPGGTGSVSVDSGTGDTTVTVSWTMPNGEAHRYVTTTTVAATGS
jgi:type IV pilus assembly protein PilV